MKNLILISLLAIVTLSVGCNKDEDLTELVVGTYVGSVNGTVTGPQTNYSVSITKVDDHTIAVSSADITAFNIPIQESPDGLTHEVSTTPTALFEFKSATGEVSINKTDGSLTFNGNKQ